MTECERASPRRGGIFREDSVTFERIETAGPLA
jgi:hypothetical protein